MRKRKKDRRDRTTVTMNLDSEEIRKAGDRYDAQQYAIPESPIPEGPYHAPDTVPVKEWYEDPDDPLAKDRYEDPGDPLVKEWYEDPGDPLLAELPDASDLKQNDLREDDYEFFESFGTKEEPALEHVARRTGSARNKRTTGNERREEKNNTDDAAGFLGRQRSGSPSAAGTKIPKRLILIILIIVAALLLAIAGWQLLMGLLDGHGPAGNSDGEIRGVDVSSYQQSIDWEGLADEGYGFAYVKATEGSTHVDPAFEENWEGARHAGLVTGAYHFLSFETEAKTQAESFINTVPKEKLASLFGRSPLPPVVDLELYGDYEYAPPSQETLDEILQPLLEEFKSAYGKTPIIYANPYVYETYLSGHYDDYPIWISDPDKPETLSDGREWTFCQYSFEGSSPNVDDGAQDLDLDVFRGTFRELRHLK